MKRFAMISAMILGLVVQGNVQAAAEEDTGNGLEVGNLEKLAGGFIFTEGPAVDREGNIFFTDQPNDRILKWSIEDILSVWKEPAGRSNGLFFDREGNLIACADEQNQLWRISPSGEVSVLLDSFDGKLLNGPNDVWVNKDNSLYFTDPFYRRPYWKRGETEQPGHFVYYLSPDRTQIRVVEDQLVSPNGIIGSPDGGILYVADIRGGETYRYRITADGSLADRVLFCEMGSDGMTLDWRGNLYLTGDGVFIFNRHGKEIGHIDVPEKWTANVCFGGKDRKDLFITASQGLYRVRIK